MIVEYIVLIAFYGLWRGKWQLIPVGTILHLDDYAVRWRVVNNYLRIWVPVGAGGTDAEEPISDTYDPVTPPIGTSVATISGTIYEDDGNTVIPGATVYCSGKPVKTATANGAGVYTIADVPIKVKTLTAQAPGFLPMKKKISLSNGVPLTQNFNLGTDTEYPTKNADLSGTITAAAGGAPIENATITCVHFTAKTDDSLGDGTYQILAVSTYETQVKCEATGYVTQTKSVTITDGGLDILDFSMVAVP